MYLVTSLLYEKVLKVLDKINIFYRFTGTRTKGNISAMQHWRCNAKYNTAQYWRQTQFQNLINLSKWYIQVFLVKMMVQTLITETQEIDNSR